MKIVKLFNNTVQEIVPDGVALSEVAQYYNEAFAAECVEAPDEVVQGWVYGPETGEFSAPEPFEPPEPSEPEPDAVELLKILLGVET